MEVRIKLAHLVAALVVAALAVGLLVGHFAFASHHSTASASGPAPVAITAQPDQGRLDESDAQAHVRGAVPAMEAYNADNSNGYAGVTLHHLQASYDAGVNDISIVRATPISYCIESTVGSATYHKEGPAGDIEPGHCSATPSSGSGESTTPSVDAYGANAAQGDVRASVPAMEAYNADHGSYAGATLAYLRAKYDAGMPEISIVRATRSSYCIERTVGSATYHKDGPAADILPGRC